MRAETHHPVFATTSPTDIDTILRKSPELNALPHSHSTSMHEEKPPQKIAKMFGGLATPPGTLHGSLATKKLHRPSVAQRSARPSSQNSSPMGHP